MKSMPRFQLINSYKQKIFCIETSEACNGFDGKVTYQKRQLGKFFFIFSRLWKCNLAFKRHKCSFTVSFKDFNRQNLNVWPCEKSNAKQNQYDILIIQSILDIWPRVKSNMPNNFKFWNFVFPPFPDNSATSWTTVLVNNFFLFSKNMQPSGKPRKSGKIIGDRKFR